MKYEIELFCKNGHIPEKIMISGIMGPDYIASHIQDNIEIRFRCKRCGITLNTLEIGYDRIKWNSFRKVGKLTRFDNFGNIIE